LAENSDFSGVFEKSWGSQVNCQNLSAHIGPQPFVATFVVPIPNRDFDKGCDKGCDKGLRQGRKKAAGEALVSHCP
jgi:hypothetical protein